jgi:hypothetical protein
MPAADAYDVVVLGAGAGGMTAAAVAAAQGLRVLVIEKTRFVGGTTAWSGGMVWIPVNAKMRDAGLSDSRADAEAYLASTVPENDNAALREAFLSRGPEAIAYLEANTEVRLQPVRVYPDYHPDRAGTTAGGRVLEPVVFDGARLGIEFGRLRPPLPEFTLFGGMMVNRSDIPHLNRPLVAFDVEIDAAHCGIRAAAASRAAGNDAPSRQRAGGAPLCVAAGAEGRNVVRRQRV